MRAQRRPGQAVDPMIYCDYYILYIFYQRTYDAKVIDNFKKTVEQKDEKIDEMIKKNGEEKILPRLKNFN